MFLCVLCFLLWEQITAGVGVVSLLHREMLSCPADATFQFEKDLFEEMRALDKLDEEIREMKNAKKQAKKNKDPAEKPARKRKAKAEGNNSNEGPQTKKKRKGSVSSHLTPICFPLLELCRLREP